MNGLVPEKAEALFLPLVMCRLLNANIFTKKGLQKLQTAMVNFSLKMYILQNALELDHLRLLNQLRAWKGVDLRSDTAVLESQQTIKATPCSITPQYCLLDAISLKNYLTTINATDVDLYFLHLGRILLCFYGSELIYLVE